MAIALYQLRDRNYESLLQWPLQNGPVHVRREAQEFIAAAKGVAEMPDNVRQCDGSDGRRGPGGADPVGRQGPRVVTLLLDLTQRGIVGAREALSTCLQSADPDVRMFGALALSAYDREAAVEHLAGELRNPPLWLRGRASQFLLQLGDARSIPGGIDQLESSEDAIRKFACRDLRWYTQQPLPCDGAGRSVPRSRVTVWREWWRDNAASFRVRTREAELDRQAFPAITAVGFGIPPVR
jgi:hypothetical protein